MKKILFLVLGISLLASPLAFAEIVEPTDMCLNIAEIQTEVPAGKTRDSAGNCNDTVTAEACMKDAVAKREAATLTNFNTFSTAVVAALNTRSAALAPAWSSTDIKVSKTAAVRTVWKDYKKAYLAAKLAFKKAKTTAWTTYKTEVKTCKTKLIESSVNDLTF